ncbi:hypothetical protein [Methylobacterium sp. J-076]|uniref:hypothetical protein n=1 Tax=Methylobacterium sp. J-076 TaxID=2836655 RepID=UPI001FBAFB00|nr:hypothetical protein [Methylobacterium sp. J-076]MCJ2015059.1 hypothetical protein [Methylobacterium sp. J-076]
MTSRPGMATARRALLPTILVLVGMGGGSALAAGKPAPPAPVPAPANPAALDAYAEAAATTILAEQNCPGTHLRAGRLTTLRLAAKVGSAQEGALEAKLRSRAAELRQRLSADGQATWCDAAFDAFGPQGTIARDVLTR